MWNLHITSNLFFLPTLVSSSWTFTCTNLWKRCVNLSVLLQDLPVNSPIFVHQIDLQSPVMQKETPGSFYLDELIITDRAVIGKVIFFPPQDIVLNL